MDGKNPTLSFSLPTPLPSPSLSPPSSSPFQILGLLPTYEILDKLFKL